MKSGKYYEEIEDEAKESLISTDEQTNVSLNFNSYEQGRVQYVQTKHGDIQVTICGDEKLSAMVTFSDMGLTYKTCYMNLLLATSHEPVLVRNFCFYHFQFPGIKTSEKERDIEYDPNLTLQQVAEMVAEAVGKLGLTEPMLMGVGVGGNVMLRVAEKRKNSMSGLILISPCVDKANWYEYYIGQLISSYLKGYINNWTMFEMTESQIVGNIVARTIRSESSLDNQWRTQEVFKLLKNQVTETLRASPKALKTYYDACMAREPIQEIAKKVKTRVLLICGNDSMYRDDTDILSMHIRQGNLAHVEFDKCASLIPMQKPEVLISPLKLYFQGCQSYGYGQHWIGLD